MSHLRNVNVAFQDTAAFDAFSRLRVSENVGIFDSTFEYDLAPLRYNAITGAGGTVAHLPNESSALLSTIASPGSVARLVSKANHRYLPGKSQFAIMTYVLGTPVAGAVKRVGYFDDGDGVFLEENGVTDHALVLRTSTSGAPSDANRVVQASWNLDTFDGSGSSANPSRILLDHTKGQILALDLQWLGQGRVRVGFDIDGRIWPAHAFKNANNLATVYMKTACLPVQWRIQSAAGVVASMRATCATVSAEGGFEKDQGFIFSKGTAVTAPRAFTAGTPLPVIAIRPALLFGGKQNRIQLHMENIAWLATSGAAEYLWQLYYNPTITGGAWAAVDANSSAEANVTGTAIAGSGIVIAQGFDNAATATRQYQNFVAEAQRFPWCLDAAGNQIVMALVFTEGGGTTDILASMQWRELR